MAASLEDALRRRQGRSVPFQVATSTTQMDVEDSNQPDVNIRDLYNTIRAYASAVEADLDDFLDSVPQQDDQPNTEEDIDEVNQRLVRIPRSTPQKDILEMSRSEIISGLSSRPPTIVYSDVLFSLFESAALEIKSTFQSEGLTGFSVEDWLNALMMSIETRVPFAEYAAAIKNLNRTLSLQRRSTRSQILMPFANKELARSRLRNTLDIIAVNLEQVSGSMGISVTDY